MASLVDTNILVYCFDLEALAKRAAARELLRKGTAERTIQIAHQALVEFVSVATRTRGRKGPLMPLDEAVRQAEGFMSEFPTLYPTDAMFRTALRGMVVYHLPWFDAHMWAYAEHYGIPELLSEDFEHGRRYGTVRILNPFVALGIA